MKEGYKKTELGLIPKEWKLVRFNTIFERITKKNSEDNKNILTISAQYGLINQEKFFNKTVASKNTKNYFLLENGDFAYNKSYSNGYPMGAIKKLEYYDKGIVSPLYICFRLVDFDSSSEFYKYFFEYDIFDKCIASIAQEGARNHGLLNVGISEFFNLLIIKPPLAEQEKIAEILSTVDSQIDDTDRLIEKTKELKKGLMQRLLTKGIGHSEFKKSEVGEIPVEWEVKKLEDVCEILDGMRKPIKASDRENIHGKIPYYGASGIIDWINDYIFDDELILLGEDGENIKSRNLPLAFRVSGKCWVNNHAHVLKSKVGYNEDYITYVLENKDYSQYVIGSAQPKLTQKDCRNFLLQIPSIYEQEKIADILSSVDIQISEYENEKTKLEELKQGLMQQLLTGKIRVV